MFGCLDRSNEMTIPAVLSGRMKTVQDVVRSGIRKRAQAALKRLQIKRATIDIFLSGESNVLLYLESEKC